MHTVRVKRQAMGTDFEVILYGGDPDYLTDAANMALEELALLEDQLSIFLQGSEVSDINAEAAGHPVRVEPELFELLTLCQRLHRETDGAFDITVRPLLRCWRDRLRQGRLPSAAELSAARRVVGMGHVRLDPDGRTIAFDREGVAIDLGGVGKGYAVDHVAATLRRVGLGSALVHAGRSSVLAIGAPPGEEAWTIGVRHPLREDERLTTVALRDRAVSTSGGSGEATEVAGTRYCHIIDPRTGEPVQGMLSCSALTGRATEGDALSTGLFVLGADGARRHCREHRDIEAILVPAAGPGAGLRMVRVGGTQPERSE